MPADRDLSGTSGSNCPDRPDRSNNSIPLDNRFDKVGIPDRILFKPRRPSQEERKTMKIGHASRGESMPRITYFCKKLLLFLAKAVGEHDHHDRNVVTPQDTLTFEAQEFSRRAFRGDG